MKSETLTPYEAALYDALKTHPEGVTYVELSAVQIPVKKGPKHANNKFATHIATLRRKLGVKISNVHEVGYKLEQ